MRNHMNELDQLIEKFWTGRTTDTENQQLLQLLEQQGGDLRQRIRDEFDRRQLTPGETIGQEKAQRLLEQIHTRYGIDQTAPPRISWLRRSWKGAAVAACLLLVTGVLVFQQKRSLVETPLAPIAKAAPAKLIRVNNNTDTLMTVALKDGSVIQLQKNSGVSYYEPFINDRRDVSLSGIAMFKVAKDKDRPFSVYAGGTITRVLGTKFLVNTSGGPKVTVRLLEGSIAVETRPASGAKDQAIVLKTGEEIAVNQLDHSYTVNTVIPAENGKGATPKKYNSGLAFNKEPLRLVFRKIGARYGIDISYDPKEMTGLNFTGTFLRSDELNSVLATICNVNDLSFKQEGDTVRITRLH
jgi:ferric-dicitrate binding protein FerR (iron transport regulator)